MTDPQLVASDEPSDDEQLASIIVAFIGEHIPSYDRGLMDYDREILLRVLRVHGRNHERPTLVQIGAWLEHVGDARSTLRRLQRAIYTAQVRKDHPTILDAPELYRYHRQQDYIDVVDRKTRTAVFALGWILLSLFIGAAAVTTAFAGTSYLMPIVVSTLIVAIAFVATAAYTKPRLSQWYSVECATSDEERARAIHEAEMVCQDVSDLFAAGLVRYGVIDDIVIASGPTVFGSANGERPRATIRFVLASYRSNSDDPIEHTVRLDVGYEQHASAEANASWITTKIQKAFDDAIDAIAQAGGIGGLGSRRQPGWHL